MKFLEITNLGYLNGGVETGLVLLRKELESRGHTVKIFTSNQRPDITHIGDVEFEALVHKPRILQFLYRAFYPDAYVALKKLLAEYQPDVVHLHTLSQISPSVLFLLKKYYTIATVHQSEDYTTSAVTWGFPSRFFKDGSYRVEQLTILGHVHYLYHKYVSRNIYKLGFRNVDVVIAISRYMHEMLAENNINSVIIPNATKLFDQHPIDAQNHNLLFVGRLEQTKGVQVILEALPQLKQRFPDVHFFIAGRGEYQAELEKLSQKLGLEKSVDFLGFQDRASLYELYKKSTVVIMPSIWSEAFGNVGIEAMSVGRPVIASNVGGISDWLTDGEVGYLVQPENPGEIAEKVIMLFSDSLLLERFAENARREAEKFSIENHVNKLLELITKINI